MKYKGIEIKEFVNKNYIQKDPKTIEASGIDNALEEMTVEDYDKNPEKRMRQAWNDYYEKQLPLYKVAYPNLKRSQYIQMIQKEFKTSSENPVYVSKIQKAKKAEEEESEKSNISEHKIRGCKKTNRGLSTNIS